MKLNELKGSNRLEKPNLCQQAKQARLQIAYGGDLRWWLLFCQQKGIFISAVTRSVNTVLNVHRNHKAC